MPCSSAGLKSWNAAIWQIIILLILLSRAQLVTSLLDDVLYDLIKKITKVASGAALARWRG